MIRIIFLTIIVFSCLGFDWNKCKKAAGPYTVGAITVSTSSFLSSTGGCAMIGIAEHDKKVFLVNNFENLKIDSAIGAGKYLSNYAILAKCNKKSANMFPKVFHKNFIKIYGAKNNNTPKEVYRNIENIIANDPILSIGCKIKS